MNEMTIHLTKKVESDISLYKNERMKLTSSTNLYKGGEGILGRGQV